MKLVSQNAIWPAAYERATDEVESFRHRPDGSPGRARNADAYTAVFMEHLEQWRKLCCLTNVAGLGYNHYRLAGPSSSAG